MPLDRFDVVRGDPPATDEREPDLAIRDVWRVLKEILALELVD